MYPIRTVSEMTGINPVTLRAWERRYGLIQPQRTPKGHRLYTDENIEDIREILHLLNRGISISRIREVLQSKTSADDAVNEPETIWSKYQMGIIQSINQFDEFRLEVVYNEVLSLYPIDLVTRKLLLPLLEQLGERWKSKQGNVAEEHFFSMYMRNKLGAQFHHLSQKQQGPLLLGACFPGEHHVFGLLLFALAAREQGYRMILLGADMPLEELPIAVARTDVDAIVLSSSIDLDLNRYNRALSSLVKNLNIPIFIGGKSVVNSRKEIEMIGAIPVGDDLRTGLNIISHSFAT